MTQSWLKEKEMYSWGRSSAGRAPALQAGGQGFESPHLHSIDSKGFIEKMYLENFIQRDNYK